MDNSCVARVRLGAVGLAIAGVLFVLYPAFRPWHDESTVDGAIAAMDSTAWVMSHLFAMLGFILVAIGLLALRQVVSHTPAEPTAFVAVLVGWIGAGLTLTYYGAETFGLNAIAGAASRGEQFDLLELVDDLRFGPVAVTIFGVGLIALAIAGVLAGVAVWRSALLPRYSGLLFAIGLVLFLPQFFTPPAVRIAHGVILGVGALWLGMALRRVSAGAERVEPARRG